MTTTIHTRLNFSDYKPNDKAVKINKWSNVNHYETLCLYCAENAIPTTGISDEDFDGIVIEMENYGRSDKSIDHYYFWID